MACLLAEAGDTAPADRAAPPRPAPAPSVCDHLVSGGDLARLQAAPRQRGGDHEYRISNTTETPIFCLFPLNFRSFPVFVRQFQQTQFFPLLMRCDEEGWSCSHHSVTGYPR